jgi:hypothetical protein
MKQVVFGGVTMDGYFIECKNKEVRILSHKRYWVKQLSIPKSGSANYPKVTFRHNGKDVRADVHRVVAENLIPFPRPSTISEEDWENTPDYVKSHIKLLYCVNHIDHDKYNCHPSNLEWVTPKQNSHKFQEHRRKIPRGAK